MTPQPIDLLISLGWQLAGWAAAPTLVAVGLYGARLLQAHIAAKQWDTVSRVAGDAVGAAYQYLDTKTGQEKRAWVDGVVQSFLDAHGWKLDAAALDAQIESEVRDQKAWAHAIVEALPGLVPAATQIAPPPDAPKA